MNERIVNVIRESTVRQWNSVFRSFWPIYDHWPRITFDQLYDTLAHGEPGDYILVGA